MERRCAGPCKQLKSIPDDFSVRNKAKGTFQPFCKECKRTYYGPRWRARHKHEQLPRVCKRLAPRQELMRQLKSNSCKDCGRSFHHFLMDFDHRDGRPDDQSIVVRAAYRSEAIFLAEIEKCDVVCVMCHRTRTWNRTHPDDPIPGPTGF